MTDEQRDKWSEEADRLFEEYDPYLNDSIWREPCESEVFNAGYIAACIKLNGGDPREYLLPKTTQSKT